VIHDNIRETPGIAVSQKQNNELSKRTNNGEGCCCCHLMEYIHNNLMKLGESLRNVPQKLKKNLSY
jgi:hypothetical protein